jgi:hypothetical protein
MAIILRSDGRFVLEPRKPRARWGSGKASHVWIPNRLFAPPRAAADVRSGWDTAPAQGLERFVF